MQYASIVPTNHNNFIKEAPIMTILHMRKARHREVILPDGSHLEVAETGVRGRCLTSELMLS